MKYASVLNAFVLSGIGAATSAPVHLTTTPPTTTSSTYSPAKTVEFPYVIPDDDDNIRVDRIIQTVFPGINTNHEEILFEKFVEKLPNMFENKPSAAQILQWVSDFLRKLPLVQDSLKGLVLPSEGIEVARLLLNHYLPDYPMLRRKFLDEFVDEFVDEEADTGYKVRALQGVYTTVAPTVPPAVNAAFDNLETAIFKLIRAVTSAEQPVTPTLSHAQNRAVVEFVRNAALYLHPFSEDRNLPEQVRLLTAEATNSLKALKANPASGTAVTTVNPPANFDSVLPTVPPTTTQAPKRSGLSGGAIAGITVGSIAGAGLLITVGTLAARALM